MTSTRSPVIVYARDDAVEQARRLLPGGRVLENLVEEAITAGAIEYPRKWRGRKAVVRLDGNVVALVKRERSPVTRRRTWKIVQLLRAN